MKYLFYFLVLVLISACQPSKNIAVTLSPLPDFIIELNINNYLQEDDILCMRITQKPLWESGEYDGALYQHIYDTRQIRIDDVIVPSENIDMRVNPISYPIFDENRELIGSYGGTIMACIKNDGLQIGTHKLDVTLTNLSDKEFSYTTEFTFNPSERSYATTEPALLPTVDSD